MARRSLVLAVILFARMAWAVCGDGVPDPGEDCDDGNLAGGDCCSPTCTFEAAGSPCPDDGNPCSLDECDANGTCGRHAVRVRADASVLRGHVRRRHLPVASASRS